MSWVRMGDIQDRTGDPSRTSVIWKHQVLLYPMTVVSVRPGRVVHAEWEPGARYVTVWVHHDCPGSVDLRLLVVTTGQPFDAQAWEHVATAVAPDLAFVWHVLQGREPEREAVR